MEIIKLLDQLEELGETGAEQAWRFMPGLRRKTIVDADYFFALVKHIRDAVPEEVTTAGQVTRDRDRIVREAHEERAKIIEAAREQARLLVSNDELVKAAEREADEVRKRGQVEAEAIKAEAEVWAKAMIERLESYIQRITATLDKAKRALDTNPPTRVEASSPAGPSTIDS
jgi:vacuolar-type H+-ATPase subunit H